MNETRPSTDIPCGKCQHIDKSAVWYCEYFRVPLRSNQHGPIRCYDCRINNAQDKSANAGCL